MKLTRDGAPVAEFPVVALEEVPVAGFLSRGWDTLQTHLPHAMTSPIAHFNGQLLPLDRISISPLDRGFIFGDGVYEVIPVYDGVMLRGREHFERLQRSMDEIRLKNPHTVDEWMALTQALLAHHPGNQSVYIQVTRGVPPKRDHVLPEGLTPTVFMMCYPLASPSQEAIENGVACVTVARLPLGEVPHQVHVAPRQRARAPDLRRRRAPPRRSCCATGSSPRPRPRTCSW